MEDRRIVVGDVVADEQGVYHVVMGVEETPSGLQVMRLQRVLRKTMLRSPDMPRRILSDDGLGERLRDGDPEFRW
jgi:hypothetical protein